MRATPISGTSMHRWLSLVLLLGLAVSADGAAAASPGSAATFLGGRPVRFEPQHAAPTQQVRASGFDCGNGFGPEDLFGAELNDVASPPTEDEGVSLVLRDIRAAADGTASASFTIPELSPGAYHVYYLCARAEETRVFEAVPPDGWFTLDPLHPRHSAPPSEPAALRDAGVPLALLLLGALVAAALWRIARASRLRAAAMRNREDR